MKRQPYLIFLLVFGLITACSSTEKPLDLVEGLVSAAAALENNVPVTGLSGARRSQVFYKLNVPDGATDLSFRISGGSGDADLYVRQGANPTVRQFDCRPYRNGNNETCRVSSPTTGSYFVMIRGYTAFSAVNLVAKFTAPSTGETETIELENGQTIRNLGASRGNQKFFSIQLPSGATNLKVSISGGSGDADLYLRRSTAPNQSSFDCRPYLNGNNESCNVSNPQADTYFVMLRAYLNYTGVSLTASYETESEPPSPPPSTGNFDITFVFGPNITNTQKQAFNQAAARWEQVITGDLPNAQVNKAAGLCGQNEPALNGTVDDVVIYADVGPRDGPGGVLASAGPCLIRNGGLTTYGVMNFDSADAGGSGFIDTILHEMGHVLGIGTLWETFGLVNYNNNCPTNPRYSGSSAKAEWAALGGSGNIPVEQDGGGGTRCGHWDEETFSTELMTGFLNGGAANPLSRITIASLEDMGYTVNKSAADPYSLPSCSPNCNLSALQTQNLHTAEELLRPIGVVTESGEVERIKSETQ